MLKGKVAVVTGGSRGIGKAIAEKFAENGANLAIIATRATEEAKKFIEELKEKGVDARLYTCDIKNPEEVESAAEEITADFGGVDILVNNAGITRDNILPSLSIMDIGDVIDVNLKGTMFVTRSFIRQFVRKKNGNIINISSVVGLMGNKGQTNYAASKAGIIGFTKSVAKEYGRKNIRCNAVAPGFIATDMTDKLSPEQVQEINKQITLGRLGSPLDVAELVLFLASDRSSYITGEVIKVDGGMYV
ncbi:3-oxoacyl-[acyl-carrier-protein] reductase [Butyrivibrio sp. XBB1001]|uniref:3-oxoacyl-[acyl-carrier-protein] reductase n=1 Tax=Butyrivibrio sp. XBB1001 TaxID=1280682 RepID=UPI0003F5E0F8|nr:3-oxoacyl-[acyl-carrier-protein] reductase [Butyrivibrio sp. XBB1001]